MHNKTFQTMCINESARSAPCLGDHAMFVRGRKKLVGGYECSMHCLYMYGKLVFACVSKIQEGHARCKRHYYPTAYIYMYI